MASILKVDQLQSDTGTVNFASNVSFTGTQAITIPGNLNLTGGGIKFPATQIASADANTLDDYEEGTFTPVWNGTGSNPSVTYNPDNTWGRYTKIGNMVTVWAEIRTSSISGGSGTLIMPLPFGVDIGGLPGTYAVGQMNFYNVTFDTGRDWCVEFQAGQQYCYFRGSGSATTSVDLLVSAIVNTNPALIRITGTYKTA